LGSIASDPNAARRDVTVDRFDQYPDVVRPTAVRQFERLSSGKRHQRRGELPRRWHPGVIDKHRNDGNVGFKCSQEFNANKVDWVV
jgi:hypothetical protein